ncbi:MAG TPA: dockerin type I repeat-containing protein, partial [Planctomycetota bacterium]|nr:dockerin type I repeat-containing protein [Planctomycetota bacterium]
RRGDVDSNGTLDLTDAVRVLEWLFLGGEPARCPDAADVNDEGTIDLTDAVFLLSHLFLGGDTPPPPGMESCGLDPTDDSLAECAAGC